MLSAVGVRYVLRCISPSTNAALTNNNNCKVHPWKPGLDHVFGGHEERVDILEAVKLGLVNLADQGSGEGKTINEESCQI